MGVIDNPQREQQRLQQARKDAGQEQPRHRLLGDDAVEHQRQTGRDNDADGTGCADHPHGERTRIIPLQHHRDQQRSHRERRRHARAADSGEQCAGNDGHQPKRAAQAAEPGARQIDQRIGHPAPAHERRRHDKERQRHQRRRIELVDDLLRHPDQRHPGHSEQDRGAQTQHHENRHAGHQQAEEQQHDKQRHHGLSPWCASAVMVAGSKRKP